MVGITCGSFDYYIHDGHMLFLNICRQICDFLYVAVVADETITKNKNRQPYFPQQKRADNLLGTGLVDAIIYMNHDDNLHIFFPYQPDIYIIGKDQYSNDWTKQSVNFFYNKGIGIVSTFEENINSTTELLKKAGYI